MLQKIADTMNEALIFKEQDKGNYEGFFLKHI